MKVNKGFGQGKSQAGALMLARKNAAHLTKGRERDPNFLLTHADTGVGNSYDTGVAEMMDPLQYEKIVRGCRRVGLKDEDALAYYVDHVEIDSAHGEGWLTNIMVPLIRQYPETRYDMLVGALMRLNTAVDYYDFLHAKLASEGSELSAFRGGKLS